MTDPCDHLVKNGGVGYLMLILAQDECRRLVWSSGKPEMIEACNQVYEQFTTARHACAEQMVKRVAGGDDRT
jgi:hypothetical protein